MPKVNSHNFLSRLVWEVSPETHNIVYSGGTDTKRTAALLEESEQILNKHGWTVRSGRAVYIGIK